MLIGALFACTIVFALQTFDQGAAGYGRASDWIKSQTETPPRVEIGTAAYASSDTGPCVGSRQAVAYYRAAYTRHRTAMRLAGAVPYVRYGCDATRRRAVEWRDRAAEARVELAAWRRYHFDWASWLPRNWYLVGSCETGYGGPPNWRHANRSFVSAFGITRANYVRDARWSGTPQWDDRNPPTPREQYLAALAHYQHHGDGWGCPGP